MALIGKRNRLLVLKDSPHGLYLDGGDHGQILLPRPPKGVIPGELLDVFIYRDSEDRLVATTVVPKAEAGEFAVLEVVAVNRIGAFLDWGLNKDLLLPVRQQQKRVKIGDRVLVFVILDPETESLAATTRIDGYLDRDPASYKKGEPVKLLISGQTPLGFNAIINNAHRGLIYKSSVRGQLQVGQRTEGFVSAVREDGKIDLSLEPLGYQRIGPLTERILDTLKASGGRIDLDDKSAPEQIEAAFGTSKKAFKQALGALYKARLIVFENGGTRLNA